MEQKKIPLLEARDILCRVQSVHETNKGCFAICLLYKDARIDMRVLDEVYGEMNWQRKHQVIDGRLYCTIEVWDNDKGCWVGKTDVGTESNTEAEKGQASDSFKRAGFCWGIGRELYTAPNIIINLSADEWEHDKRTNKPKVKSKVKFKPVLIGYDDHKEINCLVIADQTGRTRYELGKWVNAPEDKAAAEKETAKRDEQARRERQRQEASKIPAGEALDFITQVWNAGGYNPAKLNEWIIKQSKGKPITEEWLAELGITLDKKLTEKLEKEKQ